MQVVIWSLFFVFVQFLDKILAFCGFIILFPSSLSLFCDSCRDLAAVALQIPTGMNKILLCVGQNFRHLVIL